MTLKRAFKTYLNNFNNNRPIIIAGHSQGAGHAKRLIQDFFDKKPLQNRLVAAYLIGTKITNDDFTTIPLMNKENQTGGFVTWNTFRLMSQEKKTNKVDFTINKEWLQDALCSNPVTWDDQNKSDYLDHEVFIPEQKSFPNTPKIENVDNKILVKLPKMDILKTLLLSSVKDYHKADVNLFWEDIKVNSIERSTAYLNKLQKRTFI